MTRFLSLCLGICSVVGSQAQTTTSARLSGIPFVAPSTNLYNPAADTPNSLVSETDGTLSAGYPGFTTTGFFPVSDGQTFTTNLAVGSYGIYGLTYFDALGNVVGSGGHSYSDSTQPQTFTVPTGIGAVQARFYYKVVNSVDPVSAGMIALGTTLPIYTPFNEGGQFRNATSSDLALLGPLPNNAATATALKKTPSRCPVVGGVQTFSTGSDAQGNCIGAVPPGLQGLDTDVVASGVGTQHATVRGVNGVPLVSIPGIVALSSASVNVFDQTKIVQNSITDATTGAPASGYNGYYATPLMCFPSGTTRFSTNSYLGTYSGGNGGLALYDASGNFLSGIIQSGTQTLQPNGSTITSTTGGLSVALGSASCVRFYSNTGWVPLPTIMVVAGTTLPTTYVAYAPAGVPHAATPGDVANLGPLSNSVAAVNGSIAAKVINSRLNAQIYALNNDGVSQAANDGTLCPLLGGCTIFLPPGYSINDNWFYGGNRSLVFFGTRTNLHIADDRSGFTEDTFFNPVNPEVSSGFYAGHRTRTFWTTSMAAQFAANGNAGNGLSAFVSDSFALTGGSNQERAPFYKTNYVHNQLNGTSNTPGQHQLLGGGMNCFSIGDCLFGSRFMLTRGGYKDGSDEGFHLHDTELHHSINSPIGPCSGFCTPGSQIVNVNNMSDGGELGEGLYLLDVTKAITGSSPMTGGTHDTATSTIIEAGVDVSSLPPAVSVEIASGIGSVGPQRLAPGLVTVPIVTSGVPLGFVTTTTGFDPSKKVCVWDLVEYGPTQENYEMAPFTVPDSSHIAITLAKIHYGPWAISEGGGCGWALGQEADRRQMGGNTDIVNATPILAGIDAHTVRVDFHANSFGIVGSGGYFQATCGIVSLTSNGALATLVVAGDNTNRCENLGGLTATISGSVSDLTGSHLLTSTALNGTQYTFPVSTGKSESAGSGGSVNFNNGNYTLYPMAEVLGVLNPFTNKVDGGQFTLAPNNMPLSTGDILLEAPFWSQSFMQAEESFLAEAIPGYDAPSYNGGCVYSDLPGSIASRGHVCVHIMNNTADNLILGLGQGGTHPALGFAIQSQGAIYTILDAEVMPFGNGIVYRPLHDANLYDLPFAPMTFDAHQGARMWYNPQTATVDFQNVTPTVAGTGLCRSDGTNCPALPFIIQLTTSNPYVLPGSYPHACPLISAVVDFSSNTPPQIYPLTHTGSTCTLNGGNGDTINVTLLGGS